MHLRVFVDLPVYGQQQAGFFQRGEVIVKVGVFAVVGHKFKTFLLRKTQFVACAVRTIKPCHHATDTPVHRAHGARYAPVTRKHLSHQATVPPSTGNITPVM
jgi:hypothetical protein